MPGSSTPLSHDDVVGTVGPLDDALVTEIIATGATAEELTTAWGWVNNDEPMINLGRHLAMGRVARLVEILGSLREEEQDLEGR
jgi:hypothetical protein